MSSAAKALLRVGAVCCVLALSLGVAATPVFAAEVVILSVDGAGVGYNDPAPVAPIGGNPGTTLGAQRLIAAQFAATLWGATLESDATIFVAARHSSTLACTATGATLASAGTTFVFANFAPDIEPDTWYHSALADSIAGEDLNPNNFDIGVNANIRIDTGACLGGRRFYYGLDGNEGANIDFAAVFTHELAHGLGHSGFVNVATGANFAGRTDIYAVHTLDDTSGLHWNEMATDAERAASALNCRRLSWDGASATAAAADWLAPGTPLLSVTSPASVAGGYPVGSAQFGPPVSAPGVSGTLVQALDAANPEGPTTTDGCTALTNAAAVAGNLALVDRGTCGFAVKAKNAQNAGAIGVVVANNVPGCPPPGLGGVDPTIVIPTVSITLPDANTLKAALPVSATIGVDPTRLAGANVAGNPLLFAVNPVAPGSSVSHWDTLHSPNTLMEPAVNADLMPTVTLDLSPGQMEDVGWTLETTTFLDGCDTGIGVIPYLAGQIEVCRLNAANHDEFVACVTQVGNDLKQDGMISGAQKGQLAACAGGSTLP